MQYDGVVHGGEFVEEKVQLDGGKTKTMEEVNYRLHLDIGEGRRFTLQIRGKPSDLAIGDKIEVEVRRKGKK